MYVAMLAIIADVRMYIPTLPISMLIPPTENAVNKITTNIDKRLTDVMLTPKTNAANDNETATETKPAKMLNNDIPRNIENNPLGDMHIDVIVPMCFCTPGIPDTAYIVVIPIDWTAFPMMTNS
jgi:hypothetical protein